MPSRVESSMGDLVMDDAFLATVEDDLGQMKDRLYEPLDAIKRADPSAVGEPELIEKVEHFKNRWDHSIDQMCEATGKAQEQLQKIREAFAKVDADLAAALGGK
jgi:archaellum component FlaC